MKNEAVPGDEFDDLPTRRTERTVEQAVLTQGILCFDCGALLQQPASEDVCEDCARLEDARWKQHRNLMCSDNPDDWKRAAELVK